MTLPPTVSVVIPALNEAMNLPHVLPRIPAWVSEVILVDGCSTDNTVEIARQLRPDIRIVMEHRRGKGYAVRAGCALVTGDIAVLLDADGSTDPDEIPLFVDALVRGADFAKGSRFMEGAGSEDIELYRRFGVTGFVIMVRALFGANFTDFGYGYNAFWTEILPRLQLDADGFEIEAMMTLRALRAGLRVVEVPSYEHKRIHGDSHLKTIPDGWRFLKTILREYFRPYRETFLANEPVSQFDAPAGE